MTGHRTTLLAPDALFDAAATLPPKCRSCGTTRPNLCRWEADRDHYPAAAGKRPKTCLNSSQLRPDQPLPY